MTEVSMVLAVAARPGLIGTVLVGAVCSLLTGCDSEHPGDTVSMMPIYSIEGSRVVLESGVTEGKGGNVTLLTSAEGDLDGDGFADQATILVHDSPGSGRFYYLNAHLNDDDGALLFSGEAFLGDRIKFDFVEIYKTGSVSPGTVVPVHPDDHGKIVVAYYVRNSNQTYAEEPSIYLTRHWKVIDGKLLLVEDY